VCKPQAWGYGIYAASSVSSIYNRNTPTAIIDAPGVLLLSSSQEFRRNAFNSASVEEALDLLDFCYKIIMKAGLAEDGTYVPRSLHPDYNLASPQTSIDDALEETKLVVCGAVEGLMAKQGGFWGEGLGGFGGVGSLPWGFWGTFLWSGALSCGFEIFSWWRWGHSR
jgi:hypothetical protein